MRNRLENSRGVSMEKIMKRRFKLQQLAVVFGISALVFIMNVQKVSAEELNTVPYLLKVNRVFNTITVYEKDVDGNYSQPIKAMICSVGKKGRETIRGTFQTKAKYRWKALMGDVWGQYSTRIVGGVLFHSVYYYEYGNPATLATGEYNKLGSPASHGCIRLTVEDAKWIYDNCPVGTTVIVYDDKESPGPLGKPEAIKLPSTVRWDPTDPYHKNPYIDKKPSIGGIKSHSVLWGDEIDLLNGVKAKSTVGTDITPNLMVKGEVNTYLAGDYKVIYTVTDALGRTSKKIITVSVKDSPQAPVFEGISDRVIGKDVTIDEAYALSGVAVSCSDIYLNKEEIEVTIEAISEAEYHITYEISVGLNVTTTEYATFYVDMEPPILNGITDRTLDIGQVPDQAYALSEVSVTDNYSVMDQNSITVTINITPEGNFFVTYEAEDEMGNKAYGEALFHY